MKNKGIFITVEGTDGAGKTTQIKLMENYLKEKGFDVVLLREPGGTKIGEKIRTLILDVENSEMSQTTELLLYAASRAQLVSEVIKPAIEKGSVVICDRFVDSSVAYQGYGRDLGETIVKEANKVALAGVVPNITFFFDLSPEIALKRRLASTAADRIEQEKLDFHLKVYNGYKELALKTPERIKIIDSNRSIEDVFSQVKTCLEEVF